MSIAARTFITPMRFHSNEAPASDVYVPDDMIYFWDGKRLHGFKYIGVFESALGKELGAYGDEEEGE